jgi:hypothetical protein
MIYYDSPHLGGIHKTSYDNLTFILKSGVPYLNKVNLKRPHPGMNMASHQKY